MQSYSHTYVLDRIIRMLEDRDLEPRDYELLLGNIMPDLATYNYAYQAIAHDYRPILQHPQPSEFEIGAALHILADNDTTLGVCTFHGDYRDVSKTGFMEQMERQFSAENEAALAELAHYKIPTRRFVQCALDYQVRRHANAYFRDHMHAAQQFLQRYEADIFRKYQQLYPGIPADDLQKGINRYHLVYGAGGPAISDEWRYRLFPIARPIIKYEASQRGDVRPGSFMKPDEILHTLENHPEVVALVEQAEQLLAPHWMTALNQTGERLLNVDFIRKQMEQRIPHAHAQEIVSYV